MTSRVLVACVGNVLRGDDGFGVAVARQLAEDGWQHPGVDLIETGIGGLSIVQQLMEGYQALVVVDAVDHGAAPGTVIVLEPEVGDPRTLPDGRWQTLFSNLHLAEPHRVLLLARGLGVLPSHVVLVGCQPGACEDLSEVLSPPVLAAVRVAAGRVREITATLAAGRPLAWQRGSGSDHAEPAPPRSPRRQARHRPPLPRPAMR